MKSVWVVDDDASIRFVLQRALERKQLPVSCFASPSEVLRALQAPALYGEPEVLVTDIRMPDVQGLSGLDLLTRLHERFAHLPIIITTAYSDLDSAVAAFQGGAFEYLPKPFDVTKAVELVQRALEQSRAARAVEPESLPEAVQEILGQALAMQEVFRAIGRLAHSHATVLITGESGSGKELVARALHRHSPRAQEAFVTINTTAIPKDLLESELFGHERGAFAGALTQRRGRLEQAEGGTLFLDEVGDMPLELQTRLLRVLSDGCFYRMGGQQAIQANVRIIAATHQNLEEQVRQGRFRSDLFHRLSVIRLRLPALRERREDIPLLAHHFLQRSALQLGVEPKRLNDNALLCLERFAFPGNVRQLENICHWLTVMAPSAVVDVQDLPPEVLGSPAAGGDTLTVRAQDAYPAPVEVQGGLSVQQEDPSGWAADLQAHASALLHKGVPHVWDSLMAQAERALIQAALQASQHKRMEAAQRLGIGRNTISRKMQELGMR